MSYNDIMQSRIKIMNIEKTRSYTDHKSRVFVITTVHHKTLFEIMF